MFKVNINYLTGKGGVVFTKGNLVERKQLVEGSIDELLALGFITDQTPAPAVIEKPKKS